jgi:Cu/Ag efflux protein CusF
VFLCCPACKEKALANSKQTLATVADLKQQPPQGGAKETSTLPKETGKQYDIVGKVTAVDSNKKTVTIDHEAIEGLMSAMEMPYKLDNSQVLKGIKPGDQIRGRLEVRGPDYVITELHKR